MNQSRRGFLSTLGALPLGLMLKEATPRWLNPEFHKVEPYTPEPSSPCMVSLLDRDQNVVFGPSPSTLTDGSVWVYFQPSPDDLEIEYYEVDFDFMTAPYRARLEQVYRVRAHDSITLDAPFVITGLDE